MRARFRIRTAQGQELSFGSEEMFEDFVRSGEVAADDLIYDGSTGEWAPARTHSLVLRLKADEDGARGSFSDASDASGGQPPAGSGAPDDGAFGRADARPEDPDGPPSASLSDTGLGLDLSLARETTPEEAAAAFVAEMQAERSSAFDPLVVDDSLKGDLRAGKPVEGLVGTGSERASPRRNGNQGAARWSRPRPGGSQPAAAAAAKPAPGARTSTRTSGRRGLPAGIFVWTALAAAVAALLLLGPGLLARLGGGAGQNVDEAAAAPASPIPDTEEALRERATQRFMTAMRRELNGLPIIPRIWLDGRYLSAPSEYPQVRAVWQEYLTRIRGAREAEVDHYSDAYLTALDDARVTGSTRTLRLASAVAAFRASAPQRAGYYARVETLASAALHLHDTLAAVEDSITYEPAVGPAVSADPVIEAASSDPATQQLLDAELDRVAEALYAGGLGPVEASRVPTWVLEGLREAVTGP